MNDAIVPNGISALDEDLASQRKAFFRNYPNLRSNGILLFLSRIHQEKGCDLLIKVFSKVADRDSNLQLVIAGPDSDGLRTRLRALASERGVAERIVWTGMLKGDVKWGAYHAAEVFVLPSHTENFGMVVVEALARGVPVPITDKANIWREIKVEGAGFSAQIPKAVSSNCWTIGAIYLRIVGAQWFVRPPRALFAISKSVKQQNN